ncbi:NADH-ubiquinone oxidoreductase-F iron-sulfur binding region domain-containing protein [Enterocloster bolteae]|uniref:NADH-ubiquinone oxidoreductase-F iron-sulfur binding region domain-containing protein n=1 Tax=Enterocloster bolteae TaxID=208479 RepID=UPI0029115584|nr:NADH-ubiquinone oxidoreductase-F iron-sulfur binding region domain-containing protein [Enterocloster bolteae]MDU3288743.1 NADH-ubiquinone oxidoreductase-F iron-sulfur binding region domain-containing protein [Enterocloster bolteae]
MRVEDRTQLEMLQRQCRDRKDGYTCRILVCAGTGCVATGSLDVYSQLRELCKVDEGIRVELEKDVPHIGIVKSGCQGFCELGPLVRIEPQHCQYVKVQPEDCEEIVEKTVKQGIPVERLFYKKEGISYGAVDEIPYFARQTRIVLEQCGNIDAESVEEYMAAGGFSALKKALFAMTPEAVIAEVEFSGLRGRGGGGFPAGRKWRQVAAHKEEPLKYIVCNGDEGDPGAFMDGSVMEGDPCRLIEGMMLAGYAVGASEGFIYVRAEYPLSVARLKQAIGQMEERGLLGDSILGTGFSFHLHINRGAGAFVCGEGSALTASIEGHRGMPRVKPPRTVDQGLWGKPTVLNNVETYANLPGIIVNGGKWFRTIGTENSTGTKTFSVTGCIENTGLVEVPMGTTLRTIIYDICGGLKEGSEFKAVQIGGPSGGCLTEEHLDEPLDFDSVQKFNVIIGSGGLVVMDKNTCMVEVARFFMNFTQRESCGKCVPCREGTKRMLEILERIVEGKGEPDDIERLEQLADMISNTALCGLGKSAPLPVISTIKAFRKEYLEHINEKKCRAGVCQSMKTYIIDEETCRGCSKCAKGCPAGAIAGELKHVFTIRQQQCIKCGACAEACPFGAVHIQS